MVGPGGQTETFQNGNLIERRGHSEKFKNGRIGNRGGFRKVSVSKNQQGSSFLNV